MDEIHRMSEPKPPFRTLLWSLIRPYWKSEERWMARFLLLLVNCGLELGEVYLNVLFNGWNNDFYMRCRGSINRHFTIRLSVFRIWRPFSFS